MIEIESEAGKRERLRKDGVRKLARSLSVVKIISDKRALGIAETIGTFTESPLDIKTEGNEVKASLNVEDGKLHMSFSPDSFKLSFQKKAGTASYDANSPVENVQLQGPFLTFKLQEGTVRAVKENGTISIDHFDFGLYPI